MTTKTFGMFTDKGNFMVNRIVAAGERLAAEDGARMLGGLLRGNYASWQQPTSSVKQLTLMCEIKYTVR